VTTLNIDHNHGEWKLFTDSSKLNLKAVLLHHGSVAINYSSTCNQ